jgi:hypothetical protein
MTKGVSEAQEGDPPKEQAKELARLQLQGYNNAGFHCGIPLFNVISEPS